MCVGGGGGVQTEIIKTKTKKLKIPPSCSMKSTGLITVDIEEGGRHRIKLMVWDVLSVAKREEKGA